MANSLNIQVNANAVINGQSFPLLQTANTVPATSSAIKATQSVATSATQISLDAITQCGYVVICNLDPTNWVNVSFENTAAVTPQTIQPGGFVVMCPASGAVVYGKANTAAVQVAVLGVSI